MRRLAFNSVLLLAVLFSRFLHAETAPTDNPIATFYKGPEGYPAWTDGVRWSNVIDMKTYANGKNDFEKFENARDELAAKGGGVLYYPAGSYDFKDMPADGPKGRGLLLRNGVVIRGEAPTNDESSHAKDFKLTLGTKFLFSMQKKGANEVPRDWNLIGQIPEPGKRIKDIENIGVCWVHLIGGIIFFGPDLEWGANWKDAKSWKSSYAKPAWQSRVPDGTFPMDTLLGAPGVKDGGKYYGAGKGRLVFGCVLEKSALLNDYETCGRKEAPEGFGNDGYHMAKFAARITAHGTRIFIANNALPMSKNGNFIYEQTTVQTIAQKGNDFKIGSPRKNNVMWDYGRVMGIDVNKDMLSMVRDAVLSEPKAGYLEEGVAILDNWVFNHGHKGYNLSGQWMTVRNNRNERIFQKGGDDIYGAGANWVLTLDGFIESNAGGGGMISDNLSRAFDMAGSNLWVDGCTFLNTGSNPGNDGEGILCQLHGGTHIASWALTHNKNEGSVGGNGKGLIGGFDVNCLGLLVAWNETAGYAGTLWRAPNKLGDCAFIANTAGQKLPLDVAKCEAAKQPVPLLENPPGTPAAPKNVKAEAYDKDAVKISWIDNSDNEIGFRVDRQIENGPWYTIAIRPPQINTVSENPPVWIDFLAPTGKALKYRVVAINAENSDAGASVPTDAITLAK